MLNQSNDSSTCIFTSANDEYAIYAAVSLLTVREHNETVPLYILSSYLRPRTKKVLDKLGVLYVEMDLSHVFTKTWDYPIECYYIFAGPEIFKERGYTHSIYMDGDLFCAKNPIDASVFNDLTVCAGIDSGPAHLMFSEELNTLASLWPIEDTHERIRSNSGVIYFNNSEMAQRKFLERSGEIFRTCLENNIPRKGDDSLLALYYIVELKPKDTLIIPDTYNYIAQLHKEHKPIKDLVFFHFTGDGINKPWLKTAYAHTNNPEYEVYNQYVDRWRAIARKYCDRRTYNSYFKQIPATTVLDKLYRLLPSI